MQSKIFASCLLAMCALLFCRLIRNEAGNKSHYLDEKQDSVRTLTILISDYGPYSLTQIIQFSDSTMKHGFATVVYPFDILEKKDVFWESMCEVDDKEYPILERKLNQNETEIIRKAIYEFELSPLVDPYSYTDDYQYIIYVDNRKVASIFTRSVDMEKFPRQYKILINDILSMAAPIYPNYGLW